MSEQESLVKIIPFELLTDLKNRYNAKDALVVNFISSIIDRFEEYSKETKLFSINGEIDEDATFVCAMSNIKGIMIGSLNSTLEKHKTILDSINLSEYSHFMFVQECCENFILDYISEKELGKIKFNDKLFIMHLKKEEAMKFNYDVPEGFQLKPISYEDISKIHFNWSVKSLLIMDTKQYIEHCIKSNISVGLYDENNELVAWCLSFDFRVLMHLFTHSDHRRKGYASLIVKAICKKMAETLKCDIIAFTDLKNFKSFELFKNLGFSEVDKSSWIGFGQNENNN